MNRKSKRDSCRDLFKQWKILTFSSQYIFSLLLFVVGHKDLFIENSDVHDLNTRFKHDLHLPSTSLTLVQRGVFHSGSKIFNHLPHHNKKLSNNFKLFKSELKTFLLENTCYSIEEFFSNTIGNRINLLVFTTFNRLTLFPIVIFFIYVLINFLLNF